MRNAKPGNHLKSPGELYCLAPLILLWWRYLQKEPKFGRYRTCEHVTGHRSQLLQVIALLINNWDKQFPLKLKLYFGFWFLVATVYNVVKLCVSCGMCVDCTARQKHESALVVAVMSLIVTSSCIKVFKQRYFHWVQWKADMFNFSVKKCCCWWFATNSPHANAGNWNSTTPSIRDFVAVCETLISCWPWYILQMWWNELKEGFYRQNPA